MTAPRIEALVLPRLAQQAVARHAQLLASDGAEQEAVRIAARRALLDWTGVCLGARSEPEAERITDVAALWDSQGRSQWIGGGSSSPAVAAWVNGSLSHVLDYDDTHVDSILHGSGPLWACLLALGQQHDLHPSRLLAAFAVGIQVGARLGMEGRGERLTRQGWHATAVLGRIAAALAGAVALGLPEQAMVHAMALAATQAGGLTASFGSAAKPLHAGHAAMDAVLAVQLAARGTEGARGLLDGPRGLFQTLLQDPVADVGHCSMDGDWEVTRISFKPYASCQLTHAAIDAARAIAGQVDIAEIEGVVAQVHPLAIQIAGSASARTGNEAKFSLPYCIALGLTGARAGAADFAPERLDDPALQALAARVVLRADGSATRASAKLRVRERSGQVFAHDVPEGYGSPRQPMSTADLREKFLALSVPQLGLRASPLADTLLSFGEAGSLARMAELAAGARNLP